MNVEEIKNQFEIWEDELCPTEIVHYLLSIIEKYEYEDKVKWIEKLLRDRLAILSERRLVSEEVEGRCKELELTLQAIRGE